MRWKSATPELYSRLAIADLKAGKPIWTAPVKSNTGAVVLDKGYGNYDPILEKMDYLIEGVAGTLG